MVGLGDGGQLRFGAEYSGAPVDDRLDQHQHALRGVAARQFPVLLISQPEKVCV